MIEMSAHNSSAWQAANERMAEKAALQDKLAQPTVVELIRIAAKIYNVTIDDIIGPSRVAIYSRARQYVMHHAMKGGRASTATIGSRLGGRDHATVLWGAYCHANRHDLEPATQVIYKKRKAPRYEGAEPTLTT